jgi:chemotaxis signal transduction protein
VSTGVLGPELEVDRQMVVFGLGQRLFALPGAVVAAIVPVATVSPIPGAAYPLLGITQVYGRFEPVLDLASVLGQPASQCDAQARIIITAAAALRCGLLVASVQDVTTLPRESGDEVITQLGEFPRDFILGETTYHDERLAILDVGRVLERQLEERQSESTDHQ